jgi:hypothetical protein
LKNGWIEFALAGIFKQTILNLVDRIALFQYRLVNQRILALGYFTRGILAYRLADRNDLREESGDRPLSPNFFLPR